MFCELAGRYISPRLAEEIAAGEKKHLAN